MTIQYGLGMLLVGILAITVICTIGFFVINRKKKEKE
jgi:hypothetical protein|tara:strand:- start:159 stop:269 length:111 start_codon:yes stop_codon:yes gene_type:complete